MAYWVQNVDNKISRNRKSFYCDYVSDIQKLPTQFKCGEIQLDNTSASYPTAYGSDCLCLENSEVYILGKDTDEWEQI